MTGFSDGLKSGMVACDADGAVWTITIANEAKRNAFSGDMVSQLEDYLSRADDDPDVRCVVITGAGTAAFSSGHDLGEMLANTEQAFDVAANAGFIKPASMRKPVIAAVNGFAYAAGFILAMSCDLRVASANATFATPGAKVGLLPIGGQISRLFHLMPYAKVLELLYTGGPMGAEEAARIGFVNMLVPAGESLVAARSLAARVAANSPTVVMDVKRGVRHAERNGVEAGELFEWTAAELLRGSPDMLEGVSAFIEKRTPRFLTPR